MGRAPAARLCLTQSSDVYELDPDRTSLLVIDAQREYFDADGVLHTRHAAESQARRVALLDATRAAGARVVFIRHVVAADGSDAERMGDVDDSPSFSDPRPQGWTR